MSEQLSDDYGLSKVAGSAAIAAPELPYRPRDPRTYRPAIGLIGCGGIAAQHLIAYHNAGYRVVALCDRHPERAQDRKERFAPDADTYTDYRDLLRRDDIEVVDIVTYPQSRVPMVEAALEAGKHVLSQKPFVLDLDEGERLAELADRRGVTLAVNQNGRWAPHFAYLRAAVAGGAIGDLASANFTVNWDHSWTADTAFNEIYDLVLYDFAIHWFDIVTYFYGDRDARRVFAATAHAPGQRGKPPYLASALVEYEGGLATLAFNASVVHGQEDRTFLAGSAGSIVSTGPSLSEQRVTLYTAQGHASPQLEGTWFPDGFHGAMGELLCAVEERREPLNSARANLRGLALSFAAIASAHSGQPQTPGAVRRLPTRD
jgi:predicted dehydrogenase